MKVLNTFAAAAWSLAATASAITNGLTDAVAWDEYSLTINGTRQWILAGEFHYQRLPVPELWPDILQKFKANGFNAVNVYFFWSYHSAQDGVFDFETSGKNIQRFFDYAKEAGLYVIARPGPYCNGETNAGGLALWGSDGSIGSVRTDDETYYKAWKPFIDKIGAIIAANQVTEGGTVIAVQAENEYQESHHDPDYYRVLHMEQIEAAFREAGIVVPTSSNEKGQRSQSWSVDYKDVGGSVNLYGLDTYPGGLSCTNNNSGFSVVRNYYQWFQNYSHTQPEFFPEFQGGWFSPWGDSTFYDECYTIHSPEFGDVFYKNNLGQRTSMLSLYMTYGGTNWGHSAAPVVYTSYDYSAPLRETRQQWDKLLGIKLLGLFTRNAEDLRKTEMAGNGTGYGVSSDAIWTWVLKNPDTGATFTVAQQDNTKSREKVEFSATLQTSKGAVEVPDVSLDGRQSIILVTDYKLGSKKLLYSSADILTHGVFDNEVLVFYLNEGQVGEFAFDDDSDLSFDVYGDSEVTKKTNGGHTAFTWTQAKGSTAVKFSNGVVVYLLERETAWHFWAPPTTTNPAVQPDEQIFVLGPYLVRSARISHKVLHISGDSDVATKLEAYVGVEIETIVWNGLRMDATQTEYGSVTVDIPGAEDRTISLPPLKDWHSADSAPEIEPSYDDSNWAVCDHEDTLSPFEPETYPVLYSSDYGFYAGAKVYRGYFDGEDATAVNITCSGGLAFGWSAWLNGNYIGGDDGTQKLTTTSASLELLQKHLQDQDNVLTVLVDYHGHDETSTDQGVNNPRGILGALLHPQGTAQDTGFKQWKIQGNAGGPENIDPVRGPMNEGGLYAERLGWHLPDFDPSGWDRTSSPQQGLDAAGVKFYITTFHLNIDSDLDVPLGVELSAPAGTVARVMIWMNGYQYGKYVPHIGPQTRFPIPPGVVNNRGKNTFALSLWAQDDDGAMLDEVKLITYGQYQTDFEFNQDWEYLQPGWTDREQYA